MRNSLIQTALVDIAASAMTESEFGGKPSSKKRKSLREAGAAAVCLLFLIAVNSKAQIPPPPPPPFGAWDVYAASGPGPATLSAHGNGATPSDHTVNSSAANYGSAEATETATLGFAPSVTAHAAAAGGAGESSAYADSLETWSFVVKRVGNEGTMDSSVPIIIVGRGGASWSGTSALYGNGSALAQADFGFVVANGQLNEGLMNLGIADVTVTSASPALSQSSSFAINARATLSTSYSYGIQINTEVNAFGEGAGQSGTASAFVDPQVYIDPTFSQAGDYEIVFSPGIGPGATAPDCSSTIGLFGLSLAGLFTVRKRFNSP